MNEIFVINKPKGISSYDVIRVLKEKYPGETIGHGGTLDPLAEGVLIIGVGREATKKLSQVLKNTDKEYTATIELGKRSVTDDAEGTIESTKAVNIPTTEEIEEILKGFVGISQQVPPSYSAVKVRGVPAYRRARRGEKVELKPKQIYIKKIKLVSYDYPLLELRIVCASGVYIRALARDIGNKVKTGGYLKSLVRTRVGKYGINDSIKI